jgi:outer membrane protein TolC
MRTARTAWCKATLWLLAAAFPAGAGAADPELDLEDAVREALEANLDLSAQRRALAAKKQEIGIARSVLLPQVDLGARAQYLDSDRSDAERGNTSQRSVTVAAGLTQLVYDENAWAGYDIQRRVYAEQRQQFEEFRLGVVQDAAEAFLDLARGQALVRIQQENRELTRRNLEMSKSRVEAGWSGEREVLRWESQLAMNETSVVQAQVEEVLGRFELNRVRNAERETPVSARPGSVAEHGFVYASDAVKRALGEPEGERRLRDAMVRVGLARSPVLAAIDEAIAAAERQRTADRRAFWVPSLGVGAGINHLGVRSSSSDVNATEWMVGAGLQFPLLRGGGKFAALRQAQETLTSLRVQRRAEVVSLDEGIRAAFARSSAAYASLGFARQQEDVARRYFEIVTASYDAGVASMLSLLDGQSQLLTANLSVANALYGFLEALTAAERQMAFFPYLEPQADVATLLDRLEQELQAQP